MLAKLLHRSILITLTSSLTAFAYAQQPTCMLQAVEKKLAGPDRSEFLKKCEAEMRDLCDRQAHQRTLEEPAKTLFINNCVTTYYGVK